MVSCWQKRQQDRALWKLRLNDCGMNMDLITTSELILKNISAVVMAWQFKYLRTNSSQIVNYPTTSPFSIFITRTRLTNQCAVQYLSKQSLEERLTNQCVVQSTNVSKQSLVERLHITGLVLFWWSSSASVRGLFFAPLSQ